MKAADIPALDDYHWSRLWSHVKCGKPNECWPWTAARSGFGYGRFKYEGKLYSPHRLIFALKAGGIVNTREHHGSVVRHTCDNPACCNPDHLILGTQLDNVADMYARGREHHNVPPRPLPALSVCGRA